MIDVAVSGGEDWEGGKYKGTIQMYEFYTVCPRISKPFIIVSYYIKWVTTSYSKSF